MTVETAIFICSICGEPSSDICAYCTKDACKNHRCHRCKRCSDCCECEAPLSAAEVEVEPAPAPSPAPEATAAVDQPAVAEEPLAEEPYPPGLFSEEPSAVEHAPAPEIAPLDELPRHNPEEEPIP